MQRALFFCSFALYFIAPVTAKGQPKDFTAHKVVSVQLATEADVQKLLALEEASEDFDVWSEGVGVGRVEVRISPAQRALLDASALPYRVIVDDIQPMLAAERSGAPGFYDDFRSNDEINTYLAGLVAQFPLLATPVNFGPSIEGREITGIRITGPGENKPGILIHGCQHAREWLTPQTVSYVAENLLSRYESDPTAQLLVNNIEWYILPVMNPDGYEYTWTTDRFWRKNRRGSYGVDLNRNWGHHWGGQGSSGSPNSEIYRGASAFSEPETQALRDFLLAHPNVRGHVDIHTYGTLLMWPWAYTSALPPGNNTYWSIALVMRDLVEAVSGLFYNIGPVYTTIYPAAGGSVDWVYGQAGRWSITFELRGFGFAVPASEIQISAEENLPALLYFGSWIAACDPVGASLGYSRADFFPDCDDDGVPDVCEIASQTSLDCNQNLVGDECDIQNGSSDDCTSNGIPDECEPDCNHNDVADVCDIFAGLSNDCNGNGRPDECDVGQPCGPPSGVCGAGGSCFAGSVLPGCECAACCLAVCALDSFCCTSAWDFLCVSEAFETPACAATSGSSEDCNENLIPDECEADCNFNGLADTCDVAIGSSEDCNGNQIPDECESGVDADFIPDACDNCPLAWNLDQRDLDGDGLGDACDICPFDPLPDSDGDGVCNSADLCPNDPLKQVPGVCGCGAAESDTDGDTVYDCLDRCPGRDDLIDRNENSVPDCFEFVVIPTVSEWGLAVLTLLLLLAAKLRFRRRHYHAS